MNSLENRMYCIRGAVCSENTADSLVKNVGELYQELCNKNELEAADIVSIQFSITPDLDALNPATALRKSDKTGATKNIPLCPDSEWDCIQEAGILSCSGLSQWR